MSRNYDADFILYCFRPPEEIVGMGLSGWVYKDTKQDNNHPFADGKYIDTSRVLEVAAEGDEIFIITRNTTYRYIGAARDPDAAHELFMSKNRDHFADKSLMDIFGANTSPLAQYLNHKAAQKSMDDMAEVIKGAEKVSLTDEMVEIIKGNHKISLTGDPVD